MKIFALISLVFLISCGKQGSSVEDSLPALTSVYHKSWAVTSGGTEFQSMDFGWNSVQVKNVVSSGQTSNCSYTIWATENGPDSGLMRFEMDPVGSIAVCGSLEGEHPFSKTGDTLTILGHTLTFQKKSNYL